MKKLVKTLLGVLTSVMLMGMTVCAEEYTVTDVDAVLWTNGSTVVQVDASTEAAIALPPMEIGTPVHITGVTSNGYWRVEIDGATYYIVGPGLGDTIVTNEYIRKYYDRPIIQNQNGISIEIDYTEWNMATQTFRVAHTATNNTAYTVDVKISGAIIYNGYTQDTSSNDRHLMSNEKKYGQAPTIGIEPGATMSGYNTYYLEDSDLEKLGVRFRVNFETRLNEIYGGSGGNVINFDGANFHDYTTSAIRLECPGTIHSVMGKFQLPDQAILPNLYK